MLLKTILNRCHNFKSFIYGQAYFTENKGTQCIDIEIIPRKNSKIICSGCRTVAPGYDTKKEERRFEFIPILGYPVFFLYFMRRVNCKTCGVKVEDVPWGKGKHELTKAYMQFLSSWARSLSWTEVAKKFNTSWEKVFGSVEYIVKWGLEHRSLEGITAIGVDEVQWRCGHKYLTLVYQVNKDCIRLLWISKDRTEKSFSEFFDLIGNSRTNLIEFVCSDMWKPYLNVIKRRASQALNILDKFHIVARLNKSIDKVRADEHRKMKADGYDPILTNARWALLKNPKNLTKKQSIKLADIVRYNLKSIRAYFLKEEFQLLWGYSSPIWASRFLNRWIARTMKSKIEPMKKEAQTIKNHKGLILNYFRAKKQFSSGVVEGLNTKVKLTVRKSYGFREFKSIKVSLYHSLGKLPEPPITHRFC